MKMGKSKYDIIFSGVVVITVEFEFHGVAHVLTLSNIFVKTAIQLIRVKFDEHFGTNGLRNEIFIIENTLTATVVEYEMSDYGEREHDNDKYYDIGDDLSSTCRRRVADMSPTSPNVTKSWPTLRVVATQKRPRHTQFMSITADKYKSAQTYELATLP